MLRNFDDEVDLARARQAQMVAPVVVQSEPEVVVTDLDPVIEAEVEDALLLVVVPESGSEPVLHYQDDRITLWHGDCLDVMRDLPDASVDSIVTDPPYGLGFMGREWDDLPPGLPWAQECLRVLKPGGHLLAFGGTRTSHRLACAIEDAGFEIRDSIAWLYGSGFPKSLDVSKAIDKAAGAERTEVIGTRHRNVKPFDDGEAGWNPNNTTGDHEYLAPASPDAARWQGWGTALKPAYEPVVVGRKPLVGTVAANVLAHGTGALNIDGCRVEGIDPANAKRLGKVYGDKGSTNFGTVPMGQVTVARVGGNLAGRWPANVVLSHTEDCVQTGTRKIKAITGTNSGRGSGKYAEESNVYGTYAGREDMAAGASVGKGDADGMETVEAWQCAEGCPVAQLDAQSGEVRSSGKYKGSGKRTTEGALITDFGNDTGRPGTMYGDSGGASRFFPVFKYQAKAPKKERPVVDGVGHPTVKPLGLMRWLVRLVTPPGGIVLDPFAGSGTTGEAALIEGFQTVLIESGAEYLPHIMVRIERAGEGR